MLIHKTKYIRDKKHLKFVASMPCLLCKSENVQAAHIRSGNKAGTGLKPGDDKTLPLCVECHRKQHSINEREFWKPYGGVGQATNLAKWIYEHTRNREMAEAALNVYRSLYIT